MRPFDSIRASLPPEVSQPPESQLSRRATALARSMTTEVDALVKRLAASGSPVIPLNTGEPPIATSGRIIDAALAACRSKRLQRPTPRGGLPELREAIAAKTTRDSHLAVSRDEVVVTAGSHQAVYSTLSAVLDTGDEVLLPAPYRPSHRAAIELVGAHPVTVPATMGDGFKVSADQLRAALGPRTRALLFGSPCNPTGAVYTADDLRLIGEWAADEGLWVAVDETYEHLLYGGAVASSLPALVPAVRDRCVVFNTVVKTYAMSGWRVGWLVAPQEVADAVAAFQSFVTADPGYVAQAAALAALESGLAPVGDLRAALDRRRLRLFGSLVALPGVEVMEPSGGLHVFPSVQACLGGRLGGRPINTTLELSASLLDDFGVAVVPGEAFGRCGHLRISFSVSDEGLEEGIARVGAGLEQLMNGRA